MTVALTQLSSLEYGIEHDGALHYDFEMRLTTVQDNIDALEVVGADSGLKISMAMFAASLIRLGTIPKEALTYEFLASRLADSDFDRLAAAQGELKKKRRRENAGSLVSGSVSSRSASTESPKPTSGA